MAKIRRDRVELALLRVKVIKLERELTAARTKIRTLTKKVEDGHAERT